MLIFITGPSGVGKSTLRDYYYEKYDLEPISAITTRPDREHEYEIHNTVSKEKFKKLKKEDKLCLVSKNHGHFYGYKKEKLKENDRIKIIEIDSHTASKEKDELSAKVIRVLSYDRELTKNIISKKGNEISDRLNDFKKQTKPQYIAEKIDENEIVFVNFYDDISKERFCQLIESLENYSEKDEI